MSLIRGDGEPISAGRQDRQAAERRALGNALFAAALFGGVVLANGILFILLLTFAGVLESPLTARAALLPFPSLPLPLTAVNSLIENR
jgi:hypothetical protein